MPFNTSALIAILRSDTPSLEAFQACLDEATSLNFKALDATESDTVHRMLGLQTPIPAAALFFAVLFSRVAQNTNSEIPGQLLMATLNKLDTLGDTNLLICLVNAIDLVEALPTTLDIGLPGLPKLKITNPTIEKLKFNLLNLIKTIRVNEAQIQQAIAFDIENRDWTLGFSRFLIQTKFNWEEDETALLALLPNNEGLFTALGFLHGLHYTLNPSIPLEKFDAFSSNYVIEKKSAPAGVKLNVDITTLALKKNLPYPVPFMLAAHTNTTTISEHLIIATFLNPELTHQHLRILAEALRPYRIKLTEYTFNQRLLRDASEAPIVTDDKKPRVLTDYFEWDPNQSHKAVITRYSATAQTIPLGNVMKQLTQSSNATITTLSVLLTLPHVKLDSHLISTTVQAIYRAMSEQNNKNRADVITYTIKHLLSNPSLNEPSAADLKNEAVNKMVGYLKNKVQASKGNENGDQLSLTAVICDLLLRLQNDNGALFHIIQLINRQTRQADAEFIFNEILKNPRLTEDERKELIALTDERRQREDENPSLVLWPEPITTALLQQPSVCTLKAAILRELGDPLLNQAPAFEFAEAFPYMPQNQAARFQYDQLPLALLKDERLQGGMILDQYILSLPLSLLIFRNRQFNPTHHALGGRNGPNTTLASNTVMFALLGNDDAIFNLPPDEAHGLDSYIDAVIRLMINTTLFSPLPHFYASNLQYYLNALATSATKRQLSKPAGIQHTVNASGEIRIFDSDIEESLSLVLKKYLTHPAIRLALYQKVILGEPCLMTTMPSLLDRPLDELKGTPVTEATLSTLSRTLVMPNTSDFRSAIFFMAFTHEDIGSPKFDKIIRQHLLGKTLAENEKSALIKALKHLDRSVFTALKDTIVNWLTKDDKARHIAQQLINENQGETNPLLLTLMIGQREYAIKNTSHYKTLKSRLNEYPSKQEDQTEQELCVMGTTEASEEKLALVNDIKEKSRAFLAAAFKGEITWSITAPFLPLPGQRHLPLDQFSLAGISADELWDPLFKNPGIAYQFLLFLLRHQETSLLAQQADSTTPPLASYIVAFILLGKNKAVFKLQADEAYRLMSYQDALIKLAIHSGLPPNCIQFKSKVLGSILENPISLETAIKATHITATTFTQVSYEAVTEFYLECVSKNPAIAIALRQNELLGYPSLFMPTLPNYGEDAKIRAIKKCLKVHGPTKETLAQLHTRLFSEKIDLKLRIESLVLYLAFSSETDSVKAFIESWLIDPKSAGSQHPDAAYIGAKHAIEKLSPAHIKRLKSQINSYCTKEKNTPLGWKIKAALEDNSNFDSPFLILLKTGQTSGQIKEKGNYLGKLTLFYQSKPISQKEAAKYGLSPKPGSQ